MYGCISFVLLMRTSSLCIAEYLIMFFTFWCFFLQSSRMRKQVTYMEDGDEADGSDVPVHQNDKMTQVKLLKTQEVQDLIWPIRIRVN